MEAAKRAETALMGGERIGRLHGVPVTIKDLAITKDMPTQSGSKIFAGHQPTEDTPFVPRLQGRRRDHARQDHDVGIRLDRRVAQPADRHHA